MVERFFDLGALLLLLGVVLWRTPNIPEHITKIGPLLLAGLAFGYTFVLLVLARRSWFENVLERVLSIFPDRIGAFIGGIFRSLIDGFGIMASLKQAVLVFLCSLGLWLVFSTLTYLFLKAFSIEGPFLVAVTIQVFLCFAVSLPGPPGFIGLFHAAARLALSLFGVQAVAAVSYATVYHIFNVGGSILLGLISYRTGEFRFDQGILDYSEPVNTEEDESGHNRVALVK
jgi:uncharacterized membrane protein YbhN (UPF0104 family)